MESDGIPEDVRGHEKQRCGFITQHFFVFRSSSGSMMKDVLEARPQVPVGRAFKEMVGKLMQTAEPSSVRGYPFINDDIASFLIRGRLIRMARKDGHTGLHGQSLEISVEIVRGMPLFNFPKKLVADLVEWQLIFKHVLKCTAIRPTVLSTLPGAQCPTQVNEDGEPVVRLLWPPSSQADAIQHGLPIAIVQLRKFLPVLGNKAFERIIEARNRLLTCNASREVLDGHVIQLRKLDEDVERGIAFVAFQFRQIRDGDLGVTCRFA